MGRRRERRIRDRVTTNVFKGLKLTPDQRKRWNVIGLENNDQREKGGRGESVEDDDLCISYISKSFRYFLK